jgi:RNA polymerase sigma factor (sigma-70 family)
LLNRADTIIRFSVVTTGPTSALLLNPKVNRSTKSRDIPNDCVERLDPEEGAKWDLFRQGDPDALGTIFRTHYPVLFQYGLRFTDDQDVVKDCIQSLFLRIWERRIAVGPTTSAKNYLMASLRRLLHKESESNVKNDFSFFLHHEVEQSPESKLIHEQNNEVGITLLRSAFEKIPSRQKEAIYLRFYDKRDFEEIASIMGITVRATYKLVYKGLESLQEQGEVKKLKSDFFSTIE